MIDARMLAAVLPAVFVVAFLYASVGHGGASGYLAVFGLAGLATTAVVPVALVLNIAVASTAFWQYRRRGSFERALLLPFIAASIPAAFLGGMIHVSRELFSLLLGLALLAAALRMTLMGEVRGASANDARRVLRLWGPPIGAVIGFLAGMTGIGGGVFLSPLLLLLGWADAKRTAAISSGFIVVNSIAGLVGQEMKGPIDVSLAGPLLAAALLGGWLGARTGAFRMRLRAVQITLGLVLFVAGAKLVAGVFLR